MTRESKLLIDTLALAVANKPFAMPEDVDWDVFLRLCKSHNVCALAYDGLRKNGQALKMLPREVSEYLGKTYYRAIYQDAQMDHIHEILQKELIGRGIRHIFLKGICLKRDYPEPALRVMCDIDVLVRTEDYAAIGEIARGAGGVPCDGDGNHYIFVFRNGVTVEFHPNLLHQASPVGVGINPGWQYAASSGSPAMELTEEGFYLSILCHLAHHFACGGVGVRFVLDIWVCRHLRKKQPDRKVLEEMLSHLELLEFARNIEQLAECWFSGESMNLLLEELSEYIITSGSHGTTERAMLNAVSLAPDHSAASALWRRAFYPRAELEDRFPWCRNKPVLLPAAWIARAFGVVTKRGHLILQWHKGTGKIAKEDARQQREKLKRFGISIER